MYERLGSGDIVNDEGDVVSLDDYREVIEPFEETKSRLAPTDPMSIEQMAQVGLLDVQKRNRLSAQANHPAMSGEVVEQASQFQLGVVAQNALDAYRERSEKLHKLGASEHRATRGAHYQDLMITLTKARTLGISSGEVNAILALVSPAVVAQKTNIEAAGGATERPVYRDARSAAAHDY